MFDVLFCCLTPFWQELCDEFNLNKDISEAWHKAEQRYSPDPQYFMHQCIDGTARRITINWMMEVCIPIVAEKNDDRSLSRFVPICSCTAKHFKQASVSLIASFPKQRKCIQTLFKSSLLVPSLLRPSQRYVHLPYTGSHCHQSIEY